MPILPPFPDDDKLLPARGWPFEVNTLLLERTGIKYLRAQKLQENPKHDQVLSKQLCMQGLSSWLARDKDIQVTATLKMDGWFGVSRFGKVFTKHGNEFVTWSDDRPGKPPLLYYGDTYGIEMILPYEPTEKAFTEDIQSKIADCVKRLVLKNGGKDIPDPDQAIKTTHLADTLPKPRKQIQRDSWTEADRKLWHTIDAERREYRENVKFCVNIQLAPAYVEQFQAIKVETLNLLLEMNGLKVCTRPIIEHKNGPLPFQTVKHFIPLHVVQYLQKFGDIFFELVYVHDKAKRIENFHQIQTVLTANPVTSTFTASELLQIWKDHIQLVMFEQVNAVTTNERDKMKKFLGLEPVKVASKWLNDYAYMKEPDKFTQIQRPLDQMSRDGIKFPESGYIWPFQWNYKSRLAAMENRINAMTESGFKADGFTVKVVGKDTETTRDNWAGRILDVANRQYASNAEGLVLVISTESLGPNDGFIRFKIKPRVAFWAVISRLKNDTVFYTPIATCEHFKCMIKDPSSPANEHELHSKPVDYKPKLLTVVRMLCIPQDSSRDPLESDLMHNRRHTWVSSEDLHGDETYVMMNPGDNLAVNIELINQMRKEFTQTFNAKQASLSNPGFPHLTRQRNIAELIIQNYDKWKTRWHDLKQEQGLTVQKLPTLNLNDRGQRVLAMPVLRCILGPYATNTIIDVLYRKATNIGLFPSAFNWIVNDKDLLIQLLPELCSAKTSQSHFVMKVLAKQVLDDVKRFSEQSVSSSWFQLQHDDIDGICCHCNKFAYENNMCPCLLPNPKDEQSYHYCVQCASGNHSQCKNCVQLRKQSRTMTINRRDNGFNAKNKDFHSTTANQTEWNNKYGEAKPPICHFIHTECARKCIESAFHEHEDLMKAILETVDLSFSKKRRIDTQGMHDAFCRLNLTDNPFLVQFESDPP